MIKVMAGIIVVLTILLAGSGLALRKAWHDVGVLESAVQTARGALEQQVQVTEDLKRQYDQQSERIGIMLVESNQLREQADTAINTLNSYRDRLATAAQGRPVLVGRLATRATGRLMCEVLVATGGEPCN